MKIKNIMIHGYSWKFNVAETIWDIDRFDDREKWKILLQIYNRINFKINESDND